jgi:hypothetical protein
VLCLVRTGSNARSRGSVHNLIECSVCWGKDARYATVVPLVFCAVLSGAVRNAGSLSLF